MTTWKLIVAAMITALVIVAASAVQLLIAHR